MQDGREMREHVRRMNWFVDVDTMTNNTLEPPIVPRAYLDKFSDVGMQGYLGEQVGPLRRIPRGLKAHLSIFLPYQVECGDTVRAWLYQWKKLHLAMWARAGPTTARITEDHYKLLIPDEVKQFCGRRPAPRRPGALTLCLRCTHCPVQSVAVPPLRPRNGRRAWRPRWRRWERGFH